LFEALTPTRWAFPEPGDDDGDLVGAGADLEPQTLLDAYARGLFPMRVDQGGPLAWWSPEPRGVIPLDGMHVSRSLRRSARRFTVSVDRAFRDVMVACAAPDRPGGWIDESFIDAYTRLHALGYAHSVEVWLSPGGDLEESELAGGCYGVAIGGLFAGESMFHRATDASKVALFELVSRLAGGEAALFDVQWCTPHLASLGAIEVPRREYLALLGDAVRRPQLTL
jgi:leucyl/phenylalanyl-tRNA--protein transferase